MFKFTIYANDLVQERVSQVRAMERQEGSKNLPNVSRIARCGDTPNGLKKLIIIWTVAQEANRDNIIRWAEARLALFGVDVNACEVTVKGSSRLPANQRYADHRGIGQDVAWQEAREALNASREDASREDATVKDAS